MGACYLCEMSLKILWPPSQPWWCKNYLPISNFDNLIMVSIFNFRFTIIHPRLEASLNACQMRHDQLGNKSFKCQPLPSVLTHCVKILMIWADWLLGLNGLKGSTLCIKIVYSLILIPEAYFLCALKWLKIIQICLFSRKGCKIK